MTSSPNYHIFGVRHHGPGSARSLRLALEELRPDSILVEGPPDADEALPLLVHAEMQPPVALLIYAPEEPKNAAYYPFAVFSPEWQALHYGLTHNIPVRFMDLPQANQLALNGQAAQIPNPTTQDPNAQAEGGNAAPTTPPIIKLQPADAEQSRIKNQPSTILNDPLGWLAQAAGYSDGERWWEQMVEQRRDARDLFAAILEMMTELRAQSNAELAAVRESREPDAAPAAALPRSLEPLREAFMRQAIRAEQREGRERIAVVCGAWHGPALAQMPPAKQDAALLKSIPKTKVQATWVPWTYGRLSTSDGYGAGISSPGWYQHLWEMGGRGGAGGALPASDVAVRWLTRVARLLRAQDLDASSAQIIDAVRLSESLAAMRGRPLPGLDELNEATRAIFCFGSDIPLQLIHDKLIVGDTLGQVPSETPMAPLQRDLQREQKRLRLPPQAVARTLDLDLRLPNDLERSHLLHRLMLLGIPWGMPVNGHATQGTFHEWWKLQWQPELAVLLVEAGKWGNTLADAAEGFARDSADRAAQLPALTKLLDRTLLANLPAAIEYLMTRVESAAALAGDTGLLMDALPSLVNVMRYGSVRRIATGLVGHVVAGLVARICIGLPLACASLNGEAAGEMLKRMMKVHSAISVLASDDYRTEWQMTLRRLSEQQGLHGLIAGRCCRLLHDTGVLNDEAMARQLSLALSRASEPAQAAAWIEGLLRGSGLLLVHDEVLLQVIDRWLMGLQGEMFIELLPLLRRTFATFTRPERRQIGERIQQERPTSTISDGTADFDVERAEAALPLLAQLLGLNYD